MSGIPIYMDLNGKFILLVGRGSQTEEKWEKLRLFDADVRRANCLCAADLAERPAFVVIGDVEEEDAGRWSTLCMERGIPVNVVDRPELCSFFFPALIRRGELTVSVSTGGTNPAAAAWLRGEIEHLLPERTEEILEWLGDMRLTLKAAYPAARRRTILKEMTSCAFGLQRPLTEEECDRILKGLE